MLWSPFAGFCRAEGVGDVILGVEESGRGCFNQGVQPLKKRLFWEETGCRSDGHLVTNA